MIAIRKALIFLVCLGLAAPAAAGRFRTSDHSLELKAPGKWERQRPKHKDEILVIKMATATIRIETREDLLSKAEILVRVRGDIDTINEMTGNRPGTQAIQGSLKGGGFYGASEQTGGKGTERFGYFTIGGRTYGFEVANLDKQEFEGVMASLTSSRPKDGAMEAAEGDPVDAEEGEARRELESARVQLLVGYGPHPAQTPAGLQRLPTLRVDGHPGSRAIEFYGPDVCDGSAVGLGKLKDTGGWGYVTGGGPCSNTLFIDCVHVDSHGTPWYKY